MAQLIYKNGPQSGSAIQLRLGINRIGRNPANDVQIVDPSVSSFHCELHVSNLGVAFRDVGSRNGSFIEGRRVTKEILTTGKTLQLGAVSLDVAVPMVNISIPPKPARAEVFANFLPDGTQACQTHAEAAANFRCLKCEKTWCYDCVRRTGLVGSANAAYSCLECSGKCEKIVVMAPKKKSLFDHIGAAFRGVKK